MTTDTRFVFSSKYRWATNEINDEQHVTNERYFKDIVLDEKIKAYHDLEKENLKRCGCCVLKQLCNAIEPWLVKPNSSSGSRPQGENQHAFQGLEPIIHERDQLSWRRNPCRATLRDCTPGPSHAEETTVRRGYSWLLLLPRTWNSYMCRFFSNHYLPSTLLADAIIGADCRRSENIIAVGLEFHD